MRNLLEFPLTAKEADDLLMKMVQHELSDEGTGGIEAFMLYQVKRFVTAHAKEFDDFVKADAMSVGDAGGAGSH